MNFFYWLTVYELEKKLIKIVTMRSDERTRQEGGPIRKSLASLGLRKSVEPTETRKSRIPKRLKSKQGNKNKTNMCSRSNILKKIVECLENGQCQHMLYWGNRQKREFIVKFVHMNNPEFKKADYLELFRELDKLSSHYKNYLQEAKYDQNCKVRCRSNLNKLVKSKALSFLEETCQGKSIQFRKYKLNFVSEKMSNRGNGVLRFSSSSDDLEYETTSSGVEESIVLQIKWPKKTARTADSGFSDNYCTTENKNEENRNVIILKQPLIVYEFAKQMNENYNALLVMPIQDSVLCSSSSTKESSKCELMECSDFLDKKTQVTVESRNNSSFLANSAVSLSMESVGKIFFPDCDHPIEEAMEADNQTDDYNVSLRYNDLENSNNSPCRLQNEVFQDMDGETKNCAQVPSSPPNYEKMIDDLFDHWDDDYKSDNKPLQQANDPLWSGFSDCLKKSLLEESDYSIINNEDWLSFENNVK